MSSTIRIAIAEDQELVRQGFVSLLKEHPAIKVIFDVSNGRELLDRLKTDAIDIVVLDLSMPVMSGKEALEVIKVQHPKLKVIILSSFFERRIIIDYIRMGVNSFVQKNCHVDKLVEVITNVHEQGSFFDSHVSLILAGEIAGTVTDDKITNSVPKFNERELIIIRSICKNETSKTIASNLSLSTRTVEWHRSKIMAKTNCKDISTLMMYAMQHNLLISEI